MSGNRRRFVAVAALLAAAVGMGVVSIRRVSRQIVALDVCDAAREKNWNTALARSQALAGADDAGRAIAECRCRALLATGAPERCTELLERVLAEADDWVPSVPLAVHVIQTRRERGRNSAAAELARRASAHHPESGDLFYLELAARSDVEDEASVLRELEARLPASAPEAARMRATLANRHLVRGDPRRALAVLGEAPPRGSAAQQGLWFDARALAHATAGDLDGVRRTFGAWQAAGGDPLELAARYALALSVSGLADPNRGTIDLLREAVEAGDRLADRNLHESLVIRLVLTLVNAGLHDEALAVYDRARARFELAGLSPEEIRRSAAHRRPSDGAAPRGLLRFAIAGAEPGTTLLVSPEPGSPVDADFEALPVRDAAGVSLTRRPAPLPVRWVLRDARARVLGSGAVTPIADTEVEVSVAPRAPRTPERFVLSRAPADGRRRVVVLVLDCGDWRLIQYLRARGELPVVDGLVRNGYSAVLISDPPLTAAAMEALVWPGRLGAASFLGLVHQLGVELAGLSSIGTNPFAALSWILPEHEDLFSAIGAGPYVTANLLFSHGNIDAGRHSEIVGPGGRSRRVRVARSSRVLDATERARWPGLTRARDRRDEHHLRVIAAEFDTAEDLVRTGDVDLLLLRIEPLDILTHANFAQAVRDGQDDAEPFLFWVYRYIDARVGTVHNLLDADDVLIVMSDHGIRTAMEHSKEAFFVAAGADVPTGRAPGSPALAGVPRVLADLLGVDTDWRDTGLAPWATARREKLAHAEPPL